jgi:DNA mismatch endonuclease, patch repair protein
MVSSEESVFLKTGFSLALSGRKARDTEPEVLLRKALFHQGLRYRVDRRIIRGSRADIVFPAVKLAIYVDGCFWHGCPKHGRKVFRGVNAEAWVAKIRRNKARDKSTTKEAELAGWKVMRVWECDIQSNVARIAEEICVRVNK